MSPDGKVVHINSSTLIMGVTGSGKSALLGTLAEYVWETYHKITRLNSSDGGGFPAKVQALMQKGIMQVFRMRTRDLPDGSLSFETCQRAAQGWWPRRINPRTGEALPGVQLVPPITEQYVVHCPEGHVVKTVPFQSMLTPTMCAKCKKLTDKSNMRVVKSAAPTKGFEEVGAVCFDGLSSMLSWMMSDMGQRSGRLELKGEEAAIGGKVISGDMKFGGTTRSHVGFVQGHAENLIANSLGIPNLVVPPTWTALTMEVDDEGDLRVRGPKLAGRAKTDEAPQWFGNCLEAMVVKDEKDQRIFRLVLSEFVDDAGVRHLVKTRADAGSLPAYLQDEPLAEGHERETAYRSFNLGLFYTLLDAGLAQTMEEMSQRYPDAPGLPDGIVEVGEGLAEPAVAAPAAAAPRPAPAAPKAAVPSRAGTKPSGPVGKPAAVPSGKPEPAAQPEPPAEEPVVESDPEEPIPVEQPPEPIPPFEPPVEPKEQPAPAAAAKQVAKPAAQPQQPPARPVQAPRPAAPKPATPPAPAPRAATPAAPRPPSQPPPPKGAVAQPAAPPPRPAAQPGAPKVTPAAQPAQAAPRAPQPVNRAAWAAPAAPRPPAKAPAIGGPAGGTATT